MCGITGAIAWGDNIVLQAMTDVQHHRGPDDRGTWQTQLPNGNWVRLGSRRLAILDLSPAGHMPMQTVDGRLTIVYNGEVYNYPQLRAQLETKGYQFRSNSDTEAILYMYQEYGPECVRQLNGMFAIAIWDAAHEQLFLARDHFGIKPLYYTQQGEQFAFGSEVKSFFELPGFVRKPCLAALNQYLTFLWVPDPLTMFEGVYKLPAGHYAIFKHGRLHVTQFWDLAFPPREHIFQASQPDLTAELKQRFFQSVKSQMLSDVPLGAFLSAGLDSSSIVSAMAAHTDQPVRTFTIAFPKKYRVGEVGIDDPAVARRTAQHFGCKHTEIIVDTDVVGLLPKLIWHMDEPVADPAIITAYLVNREARKDVTVLLSGIGGDELFAGYRKYQAHFLAEHYRRIPSLLRQHVIEPSVLRLPSMRGTPMKGYIRLAKKMARSGSLAPRDRYLMDSVYLSPADRQQLYSAEYSYLNATDARSQHLSYFEHVETSDFLNQMLYLDVKTFMASLNLTYNDKMSMASSVEVRVPFLDWQLAEWVSWNVPPSMKMRQGTSKFILREAMRNVLPAEVLQQRKAGFGAPVDYWLTYDLQEMVRDLLSEQRISQRGFFQPNAINKILSEQRSGKNDWSLQIWALLTLELWYQAFIDCR